MSDIPAAPEHMTKPLQVAKWLEEARGLTPTDARALLKPYYGRKGEYREELGHYRGDIIAWLACRASPLEATERLGYKSSSGVHRRWRDLNLPSVSRDVSPDPFREDILRPQYSTDTLDQLGPESLREHYLQATGGRDSAIVRDTPICVEGGHLDIDLVADSHYGPRSMDYRRWLDWIERVKTTPDLYWGHAGDLYNLGKQGKRTQTDPEIIDYPNLHNKLVPDDLAPIAPRCLFMVRGNHEDRLARKLDIDICPIKDLCGRLAMPYAGTERFVRVSVTDGKRDEDYLLYVHHGYGGGRTEGYALRKAADLAKANRADAVIIGHLHREETGTVGQRTVSADGEVMPEWCRLVTVPSFQKHQTGTYSAKAGTPPRPLGHRTIRLHLDSHRITIVEE